MKKRALYGFKPNSAEHVLAHAKWRASRGKRPSMAYVYEKNPKKALILATSLKGFNIILDSAPPLPRCKNVRAGLEVEIHRLGGTAGFIINPRYLCTRRVGAGITVGFVPGHGGDVWWVEHDDRTVGAYAITEFKRRPRKSGKVALIHG